MAFGKLYTNKDNTRSIAIKAVAKFDGVGLEEIETQPAAGVSTEYLKLNKLGKVPSFSGADGYDLTEAIAIAIYIASQNEKTALLGKTKQDYASIIRWMSYANSEICPPFEIVAKIAAGRESYNKKTIDDNLKAGFKATKTLDDHFLVNSFLVGDRLSLADIFVAGILSKGYQNHFDKTWRSENINVTRWYETVCNQPIYTAVAGTPSFIDEAVKITPVAKAKEEKPKQEKQAKQVNPAAAPAVAANDEDLDEEKPAPKPKHPLDSLPKATVPLDEMKRQYSNQETPVALKWFWENHNTEEYSLWRCDYKYNPELTMTFMSSNLIGGFFTRLEASRKYIFGAASVYGVTNDSVIQGAFVIRGQNALEAFDVAPDYDSYTFTKLNAANPEDKAFINSMWTWEEPVVVEGKKYEWADGKVFK